MTRNRISILRKRCLDRKAIAQPNFRSGLEVIQDAECLKKTEAILSLGYMSGSF